MKPLVATEDSSLFYPVWPLSLIGSVVITIAIDGRASITPWEFISVALVVHMLICSINSLGRVAAALSLISSSYRHSVLMDDQDWRARQAMFGVGHSSNEE